MNLDRIEDKAMDITFAPFDILFLTKNKLLRLVMFPFVISLASVWFMICMVPLLFLIFITTANDIINSES